MSETLAHPAYGRVRQVTGQAAVLLADNPGPMTLDGTNTWLLRDRPDRGEAVVIDPGPDDVAHLDRIVAAAGRVTEILLTHHHRDHSAGAKSLHERTGAPVRALDPKQRLGSEGFGDGDVVESAGVVVRTWWTPGHSSDSLSFLLDDGGPGAVLTGDTVLGRGTTVIVHPDGDLGDYLDSLRRLQRLGACAVLPGHGPELPDAAAAAEHYLAHRAERLDQVRAALAELGLRPIQKSAPAIVDAVYGDVNRKVRRAARKSVQAQLMYLKRAGRRP
jgi:glyoxylase-like metal-dependent hydrolase (beta-lactamase superfamily II)